MSKSGIYRIRNVITGDCYVGSAVDLRARWSAHRNGLRNGTHHNWKLQAAWDEHGAEAFSFEVVENCSVPVLREREQAAIDTQAPAYNCSLVAGGNHCGRRGRFSLRYGMEREEALQMAAWLLDRNGYPDVADRIRNKAG